MTLAEFVLAWRSLAPVVKGKCFYCGKQTSKEGKPKHAHYMTKDHVIPQSAMNTSMRGTRTPHGNCVVCCRKCNSVKEDLTMQEFKRRSGIQTFYAEEYLNVRIDDLTDITEVTLFIINARKIEGRSIKFNGRPELRTRPSSDNSQQQG
jgi:HNH endonuclease